MGSWLLKTTVNRHENKSEKKRINQQTFRINSRKIKAIGNITPTMDHYPRNGYMGDKDPQSDIYPQYISSINNLLRGFWDVLQCIRNN